MYVVLTRLLCGIGPKIPFPEFLLLHLKDWDSKGYYNYFSVRVIKILKWVWKCCINIGRCMAAKQATSDIWLKSHGNITVGNRPGFC